MAFGVACAAQAECGGAQRAHEIDGVCERLRRGRSGVGRRVAAQAEDVLDSARAEVGDLVGDALAARGEAREVREGGRAARLHERGNLGGVRLRVAGCAVCDGYERGVEAREAGHCLLHGFERGVLFRGEYLEGDRWSAFREQVFYLHVVFRALGFVTMRRCARRGWTPRARRLRACPRRRLRPQCGCRRSSRPSRGREAVRASR